jgi:hypothetical protein
MKASQKIMRLTGKQIAISFGATFQNTSRLRSNIAVSDSEQALECGDLSPLFVSI